MSPVRALAWVTLAALTAFAGLAPWTLPDPHAQDLSRTLQSPDLLYWLGTDTLGRNVMARLAEAMRTSLSLALVSATAEVDIMDADNIDSGGRHHRCS